MPGILIERGGYLREILHLLGAPELDCQWLITGLECYDTCGWPGCGKWGQDTLLLSNRDFLRDVEARDMQFVWGIFSAIPAGCTREEIFAHPLPAFTLDEGGESCYLADSLLPQHPLAFLEIVCEDSTSVTAISREADRLRPLYRLPERTEDAEANNRRWHELVRVGTEQLASLGAERWTLRRCPGVPQAIRNDRLAAVWRALYWRRPDRPIRAEEVRQELERMLRREKEDSHV